MLRVWRNQKLLLQNEYLIAENRILREQLPQRLQLSDPQGSLRPGRAGMLMEPMMEKLVSTRLQGMVDGLKAQQQDLVAGELSFQERLGLLVDQQ